jgi:regulatory protein
VAVVDLGQMPSEAESSAALTALRQQAAKALQRNRVTPYANAAESSEPARSGLRVRVPKASGESVRAKNTAEPNNAGSGFKRGKRAASWGPACKTQAPLTEQSAYARALGWLSGRDLTESTVRKKLTDLHLDADATTRVIDRLTLESALSDERFADARSHGLATRGKGPQAIRAKLAEQGVGKALAKEAVAALDINWLDKARALLLRKFGDTPSTDRKTWAKRARFLAARGFDSSVVRKALMPGDED